MDARSQELGGEFYSFDICIMHMHGYTYIHVYVLHYTKAFHPNLCSCMVGIHAYFTHTHAFKLRRLHTHTHTHTPCMYMPCMDFYNFIQGLYSQKEKVVCVCVGICVCTCWWECVYMLECMCVYVLGSVCVCWHLCVCMCVYVMVCVCDDHLHKLLCPLLSYKILYTCACIRLY